MRNLLPSDVFFQVPDAPNKVFGRGSAPDPCGGYDVPADSYSAGEGTPRADSVSPPKEAKGRQICHGFFLKSLVEFPGNLLEISLINFVDTLIGM